MLDNNLKSKALKILEEEQNQLDGCLDLQTDVEAPKVLEKTSISQNSSGKWEKVVYEEKTNLVDGTIDEINRREIIDKATTLQEFCRIIDNKIISINSQINAKKQEIVILSNEATTGNCWPGIAYSSAPFANVFTDYSTKTLLRNEVEKIRIYPKMAGPEVDFAAQNVFEPDEVYILNSTYSGYGYKNLPERFYYKNKDGTTTGSLIDGGGSIIGNGRFDISTNVNDHQARLISAFPFYRYYFGPTDPPNASRCVAIANSISTLYNEIIQLRNERDSLRSNLNVIKENKSQKELGSWGVNRINYQISSRKTANSSTINAISSFSPDITVDPSQIVVHLDVGDSESYSGIGSDWYDISGLGNNATLYPLGSPASYEYSDGYFLTFNGIDQYADTVVKASDIITTNEWSLECWFRVNGPPSNTQYANTIVDLNATSSSTNMLSVTYGQGGDFSGISTNRLVYSSKPSSGSYTHLVGSAITTGLWYQGFVVKNGSTSTDLYVNAVLSNSYSGDLPTEQEAFIRIARWTDENVYSNISMSIVKIYQKSYTAEEIKNKFDESKGRYGLIG